MAATEKRQKRGKRLRLLGGLALAVALIALAYWLLRPPKGGAEAAGIYLANGGRSILVLEHNPRQGLMVTAGQIISIPVHPDPKLNETELTADFVDGRLTVDQYVPIKDLASGKNVGKILLELALVPSAETPGDWDLIEGDIQYYFPQTAPPFPPGAGGGGGGWAAGIKDRIKNWQSRQTPVGHWTYGPPQPPATSFLHRLDDPRLLDYFKARQEREADLGHLALLDEMLRDAPGDSYLLLHRIELEALAGDADEAGRRLEEWRAAHPLHANHPLREAAHMVSSTVNLARAKKQGYDPASLQTVFAGPASGLTQRLNWLKALLNYDTLITAAAPLVPVGGAPAVPGAAPVPNLLDYQNTIKVARTTAMFDLFQGRREESLRLLAGAHRFGQALSAEGTLINRLFGILLRAISTEGLKIHVLNAGETAADLEETWKTLELLHRTPGQETGECLFMGEWSGLSGGWRMKFAPNLLEFQTHHWVADAKFQLVRAAAAARHRLLSTGRYPSTAAEFGPLLPDGPPQDGFSSASLRFTATAAGVAPYAVYSIGPDGVDDRAAIEYDPTNGSLSVGDLVVRIPRRREFPFPRAGVRAASAAELLKQFPNGLPSDGFASQRGRPLSIIDATSNSFVTIFSFGPDRDEDEIARRAPVASPTAVNPRRNWPDGSWTINVQPNPLPPGASFGRRLQHVLRPASPGVSPAAGGYLLEPQYDPTNGTTSEGDPFIRLPKK